MVSYILPAVAFAVWYTLAPKAVEGLILLLARVISMVMLIAIILSRVLAGYVHFWATIGFRFGLAWISYALDRVEEFTVFIWARARNRRGNSASVDSASASTAIVKSESEFVQCGAVVFDNKGMRRCKRWQRRENIGQDQLGPHDEFYCGHHR